nr:MAG TPA: hypothetical protein [Caudoviricetes sp.]
MILMENKEYIERCKCEHLSIENSYDEKTE